MADVFTVTAIWQGFTGAPGYSKFNFQLLNTQADIDAAAAKVRAFFFGFPSYISTGHSVTVQQTLMVHDMATGLLTGQVLATSAPAAVNGTSSTAIWAAGSGAYVGWKTNTIFNGHRVQGRTFLVPLRGQMDVDGTLLAGAVSLLKSSADTFIGAAPVPVVWSKQFATGTDGKPHQVGGALAPITSTIVPDKTGILRSRRD